ncbi:MAG: protein phosphatase 2C domain-containing protein, partial [Planctomycetota bacterium]|nr:protein phosphatase 2C domain-containing protein [Planctomycetota bacterium]
MADVVPEWDSMLDYTALSDQGMRRTNNQDSHVEVLVSDEASWQERGHLFIVADGMGAHAAGELASEMATQSVSHQYYKYRDLSPAEALRKAIINSNSEIRRRGSENVEFHNMGTTISSLALLPHGAIVGHVGDSRVYRLRDNILEQLTFDHSLVWEMRRSGQLPKDGSGDAAIPSNVITRSLGPHESVDVDLEGPFDIQVGDCFLLCSDGLNGPVPEDEFGPAMQYLDSAEAAQFLLDTANILGGPDNITATVVRVLDEAIVTQPGQVGLLEARKPARSAGVHPGFLMGGFVGMLAGLVIWFAGLSVPMAMGVAVLGLVVMLLGIIFPSLNSQVQETVIQPGQQLGAGPYTKRNCTIDKKLVDVIVNRCNELRKVSETTDLEADWSTFDEYCLAGAEYKQAQSF